MKPWSVEQEHLLRLVLRSRNNGVPEVGAGKGKGGSIGKGSIPITRLLIQGALKRKSMSKTRAWAVLLRLSTLLAYIFIFPLS